MSDSGDAGGETLVLRTADDRLVIAVKPAGWVRGGMSQLIAEARDAGADALWVQGFLVDASLGFERRGGYARFRADRGTGAVELASPPRSVVRTLQRESYRGVWGQSEPAEPDPAATFVALHEDSRWVGICQFDVEAGWIGSPGVLPELRTPDRYARLVRGAAGRIGDGSLVLETWGDSDEVIAAYERIGFRLVEYVPGWELDLGNSQVPEPPR